MRTAHKQSSGNNGVYNIDYAEVKNQAFVRDMYQKLLETPMSVGMQQDFSHLFVK